MCSELSQHSDHGGDQLQSDSVDDQIQSELRMVDYEDQQKQLSEQGEEHTDISSHPRSSPPPSLPTKNLATKKLPSIAKLKKSTRSRAGVHVMDNLNTSALEEPKPSKSRRRTDVYDVPMSEDDEPSKSQEVRKSLGGVSKKKDLANLTPVLGQARKKNGRFSSGWVKTKSTKEPRNENFSSSGGEQGMVQANSSSTFDRGQAQAEETYSDFASNGAGAIDSNVSMDANAIPPSPSLDLSLTAKSPAWRTNITNSIKKARAQVVDDDEDTAALLNQHLRNKNRKKIALDIDQHADHHKPAENLALSATEDIVTPVLKQKRGLDKDLEWLQQHADQVPSSRRLVTKSNLNDVASDNAREEPLAELSDKTKGKRKATEHLTEASKKKARRDRKIEKGNQNIQQAFSNVAFKSGSSRSFSGSDIIDARASLERSLVETPDTTPPVADKMSPTRPLVLIPVKRNKLLSHKIPRSASGSENPNLGTSSKPVSPSEEVTPRTTKHAPETPIRTSGTHSSINSRNQTGRQPQFPTRDATLRKPKGQSEDHMSYQLPDPDQDSMRDTFDSVQTSARKRKRHLETGTPEREVLDASKTPSSKRRAPKTPKISASQSSTAETVNRKSNPELEAIRQAIELYRLDNELTQFQVNALIQESQVGDRRELWDQIYDAVPEMKRRNVRRKVRANFHNFAARGTWTAEQDEELREAYEQYPGKWAKIGRAINRLDEDCRDRWRNHVSVAGTQRKEYWSIEEETRFRELITHALTAIREMRRHDQKLRNSSKTDVELIDFQAISKGMEGTRSRLQCMRKFKNLMEREASDEEDPESLEPVSKAPWRIKEATNVVDSMTAWEKLELLYAIKASGAAREGKIPWRILKLARHGRLASRLCFRHLKEHIRGHVNMKLPEIVGELIEAFEAAAPDEPPGFTEFEPSSSIREAADASHQSKRAKKTKSLARPSQREPLRTPASKLAPPSTSRKGRVALKELGISPQQQAREPAEDATEITLDDFQAARNAVRRSASRRLDVQSPGEENVREDGDNQEARVPAGKHSDATDEDYDRPPYDSDAEEVASEAEHHDTLFVTPSKGPQNRHTKQEYLHDAEREDGQEQHSEHDGEVKVESDPEQKLRLDEDDHALEYLDGDLDMQDAQDIVEEDPFDDLNASHDQYEAKERERSVDLDDYERASYENDDAQHHYCQGSDHDQSQSGEDIFQEDREVHSHHLEDSDEPSEHHGDGFIEEGMQAVEAHDGASFFGSDDGLESMHDDDYDVAEAERRYQEELDADMVDQQDFHHHGQTHGNAEATNDDQSDLLYDSDYVKVEDDEPMAYDDLGKVEELSDNHDTSVKEEDLDSLAENGYSADEQARLNSEFEEEDLEEEEEREVAEMTSALPEIGDVAEEEYLSEAGLTYHQEASPELGRVSSHEANELDEVETQSAQSSSPEKGAQPNLPAMANGSNEVDDEAFSPELAPKTISQFGLPQRPATPKFQPINGTHNSTRSPVRLGGAWAKITEPASRSTISPKVYDTKYVYSSDSESSDCEAEIPSGIQRPAPVFFQPEPQPVAESRKRKSKGKEKKPKAKKAKGEQSGEGGRKRKGNREGPKDGVRKSNRKKKSAKKPKAVLQRLGSPEL